VYQISKKLNGARFILQAMGYRPQGDMQELRIEGEVNADLVAKTAADLVVLQCDLDLLRNNATAIAMEYPEVRLTDILEARSVRNQVYTDTYDDVIARRLKVSSKGQPAEFVPRGSAELPMVVKYPPRYRSANSRGKQDERDNPMFRISEASRGTASPGMMLDVGSWQKQGDRRGSAPNPLTQGVQQEVFFPDVPCIQRQQS